MQDLLLWLYFINSIFLINHEIDSAYWKEWNLFKIRGGITTFLIIHFPLLFFVLYGLIEVTNQTYTGLIFSLILCLSGIFAFTIHMYFIKMGHQEFRKAISLFLLFGILILSIIQLSITVLLIYNQL